MFKNIYTKKKSHAGNHEVPFDVMNRGLRASVNQYDIPFPFSVFSEHAGGQV